MLTCVDEILCVSVGHRSHKTTKGVVLALGEGDVGQLGLGPDIMERVKPALVPEVPHEVVQVCAGGMHTVCVTSSGQVRIRGLQRLLVPSESVQCRPIRFSCFICAY